MVVTPETAVVIVSMIAFSERLSRLAVASSRMISLGFLNKILAKAIRWRSPPESVAPRSPTRVAYLSGNLLING
jgi:hypothetical protein